MKKLIPNKALRVLIYFLLFVALSGAFGYGFYSVLSKPTTKSHTDTYTLEKVGELDTLSIRYDKTIEQNEPGKLFGLKVGTEKSLYIFHYKAQVYYDLDQAVSHYNKDKKTLKITMPKPKVKLLLKDDKYTGSVTYYKLKDNALVKDRNDKGLKLQNKVSKDVKKDILKMKDVIPTAEKSANTTLTQMFSNDPIKVVVIFK